MKVYARQVNPEYQDPYLLQRSGKDLIWQDEYYLSLSIVGQIKSDVYSRVEYAIDDMMADISNVIMGVRRYYNSITEVVNNYLPSEKENGKGYSKKDIKAFRKLSDIRDDIDLMVKVLSIVTGKEYTRVVLRGCCQGDYEEAVFPKDEYTTEGIKNLECMYFNMGTEWVIHDDKEEPETAEDINGYSTYYCETDPEKIRRLIAKENKCNIEDVIMYEFSGHEQVEKYNLIA